MRDVTVAPPAGGPRSGVWRPFGALLAALFLNAGLTCAADRPKPAAVSETGLPPQAEPPVQAEAEEARGREQRLLRQVTFRDRQAQSTVEQAEAACRSGDASRGVELIQQILDQRVDHFVWIERDRRLASARRRALGLLSSADVQFRAHYDWAYAKEARRLLDTGKSAGDPVLIGEVARRFFHTASGFEATDWLATHWLDRGEYALAARAWSQLSADAHHAARITDAIRRKAEVAQQLLARQSGSTPWTLPHVVDVRTAEAIAPGDGGTDSDEGTSTRVTQVAAAFDAGQSQLPVRSALPYLSSAWRKSLAGSKTPLLESAIRRWEIFQRHDDKQPVAVHSAVVAGNTIALRSYEGISAVDAATGRTLWNYTAGTSFLRAWADVVQLGAVNGEGSSVNDAALDALLLSYSGNSILGTLTTDGRRVFAVDCLDIRPHSQVPSAEEPGDPHEGAQRLPRSANRLVALDLFSPAVDQDGATAPLWTVGGSIGTAHWFYRMDVNDDGRVTQAEFIGSAEDFHKLDRNGDGAIDKAESENPQVKLEHHPLHGHYFLGPPLALDGRLYAVTECDSQLNLVALRADTGAVLWIQGISYVDRPIDEDSLRSALACTPVYSSGVIVCPTQMGMLVGVDALDGALLWTYYYGDDDTAAESAWSFMSHRPYGNTGFANPPLIDGNRIVILPRQSDSIHCIALSTGNKLWKQPRIDAEFVAGAAGGVVMIVGERLSSGLSLADGRPRWSVRTGAISGCGLCEGTQYLLPLAENRIVAMDMRTGARTGFSAPEVDDPKARGATGGAPESGLAGEMRESAGPRNESSPADSPVDVPAVPPKFADKPGNLVGGGPFIVSIGPREVVVYPRAEALLSDVKDRLARGVSKADDLLLAADLELTLGSGLAAKEYLAQLPERALPPDFAERKSRLARSVLYQQLAANPDDPRAMLVELDKLSRTQKDRGRYLQVKTAAEIRRGEFNSAIGSARAFAALEISDVQPSPSDSTHLISSRSWLASLDEELVRRGRSGHAMFAAAAQARREQRAVLESGDRQALERFLAVYSGWAEADAVRLRLAEVLAKAGERQRAELLLIQNQRSFTPTTRVAAERQLAILWDDAGLPEEAAELLFQHDHPPLDAFTPDSLTRLAYERLQQAAKPVSRVRITQSLAEHCDRQLDDAYANASRPFVTRPLSPFQLIDRGTSTPADISIIDRLSGTIVDTLHLPTPYTGALVANVTQVGHFLPLGGRGALHGISLLERDRQKPLWTTAPPEIELDADPTLVGPSGPTYCVFQSHGHLVVVDPGTGKILWQRTDLDPQSGLGSDQIHGIFGDENVLVVLAPDHLGYTLYQTMTGEEIRQGRLDNESRQTQERRTFGRCLMYVTADDTNHRLRIWDPLSDRLVYDRPIFDPRLWKETCEDEVAVIGDDCTLQIVDGRTGTVRASVKLPQRDVQNSCQLAFFRDSARYYVNLQPVAPLPQPRFYNYFFGADTVLPHVDIHGDVVAIDRKSGRLEWTRPFMQRSVLRTPSLHLPVLMMLSSVGDRTNGNHRSMLVEAVDARTGETLAMENNNYPNHILHLTYEHDRRRVRLWGTRSVVDLDFVQGASAATAGATAD